MCMDNDWLKALDGKTVVGIDVLDGESDLRFRCSDGSTVVWATEGDCCSESWWADAFELSALRGHTVRSAKEIKLPSPDDDRSRQEEDVAYGVEITTDRGVAKFAFRNSSNGYYGGWAGLGHDSEGPWTELTGNDWRA
jgi:hypothetical protein